MNNKSVPLLWMGAAFAIALALAALVLVLFGSGEKSIRLALDVTARWSFLLFWFAYAGGALAKLFGPSFAALARSGREFGLAFASAHLVHVGLIVWLAGILHRAPLQGALLVFFLVAIVFTYLLAALSFGGLAKTLGPGLWRLLMFVGLNYILLAFARDFLLGAAAGSQHPLRQMVMYAPFALMCLAAPGLRIAAHYRRRGPSSPLGERARG